MSRCAKGWSRRKFVSGLTLAGAAGLLGLRAARTLVTANSTQSYDFALQTMKEVPYGGRWRQYDPEDTVRFYALRLHEAGMIKSCPQTIIARDADWRFLNELKKELKG